MGLPSALSCPQCGGPLPKQAAWRMVACPYCRSVVSCRPHGVERAPYHQAWLRAQAWPELAVPPLRLGAQAYQLLQPLGQGDASRVWLARRLGAATQLVVLKLVLAEGGSQGAEAQALRKLQAVQGPGAQRLGEWLPQVVQHAPCTLPEGERDALVLRHVPGFWGSLADVLDHHPTGLREPGHAVWLWRRLLAWLTLLHAAGWVHGGLHPGHALVHPGDHGLRLIGWAQARAAPQGGPEQVRELQQSARLTRLLLCGDEHNAATPARGAAQLRALVMRACDDAAYCAALGPAGLDAELLKAAERDFGAPRFIPFNPTTA